MLKFHEKETCEAIIRYLEERAGQRRDDMHACDNHASPDARVEFTFKLGDQLYAIEHTGIEPFDGFMEHQNRAPVAPLEKRMNETLRALLDPGVVIKMSIPIDAFHGCRWPEVPAILDRIAAWVEATVPTLSARKYDDYRRPVIATLPGVPFPVSLVRFEGTRSHPGFFQIMHTEVVPVI